VLKNKCAAAVAQKHKRCSSTAMCCKISQKSMKIVLFFSNLGNKKVKLLAFFLAAAALRCSAGHSYHALQRAAVDQKTTVLQRCGAFQNPVLQRFAGPSLLVLTV
jgi:hypothetical protein